MAQLEVILKSSKQSYNAPYMSREDSAKVTWVPVESTVLLLTVDDQLQNLWSLFRAF